MRSFLAALVLAASSVAYAQNGAFGATFPAMGTAVGTKDSNGKMQPFRSTTSGQLNVAMPSYQVGSFGTLLTSQPEVAVSLGFNYNINSYFVDTTTANGGTATTSNSKAVLQTSTATNGSAHIHSRDAIRYTPGQGVVVRFTAIFSTCVANSQQEIGVADAVDGLLFGCQGATFGIFRRQNSSDTFTAQTAWNIDKMNGAGGLTNPSGQTLDITKGNVYAIDYQWLGFGAIRFFVENSTTGEFQLVHVIRYANTATDPTIFNPSLPLHARVFNNGNTTNLTLQTASMGGYIEGSEPKFGAIGSVGNNKTVAGETAVISIRNNATFQSKTNRVRVKLKLLNSLTAADAVLRVILNTTLGGAPSFTDFDSNTSVVSFDTAGTTVTGGRTLIRLTSAKATLNNLMLDTLEIHLNPGDVATFTSSTGATDINIVWEEEFSG